jgi:hypothetical protein
MNITLDYLRGRRVWVVNNFSVWGEFSAITPVLLWTEQTSSSQRIIFSREILGGLEQAVNYSQLYDFRGNQLPQSIPNPKVIILQKNQVDCLTVGQESASGFKIAKLSQTEESGLVDLVIVENG